MIESDGMLLPPNSDVYVYRTKGLDDYSLVAVVRDSPAPELKPEQELFMLYVTGDTEVIRRQVLLLPEEPFERSDT